MATKIQFRRGTAGQWATANPILAAGEPGIEIDTLKVKIGNGTSTWNVLGYWTFTSTPLEDPHYIGAGGEPAFAGSWVNYGSGQINARFWKDPFNTVYLGGCIKNGTIGTPAFVLPTGYRPDNLIRFPVIALGCSVDIFPTGEVQPSAGANTFIELTPCQFRAFA